MDSKSRQTLTNIRHFLNSRISEFKKFMYVFTCRILVNLPPAVSNTSVVDLDRDPHESASK